MRALLIEDEDGIGKFITQGLREAGYRVEWALSGDTGLRHALDASYDIIILDIMLPGIDGLRLLAMLRDHQITTPILVLTARDSVEDRVTGLNAGADDYLVKPFDFSELLARLNALLRRPPLQTGNLLRVGDLELDTVRKVARRGGQMLNLSQREFMLLEYLMRNAGYVLTRTQIGERIWGFDFYNESNVVDVYIGYLRRKLDRGRDPDAARTTPPHSLIRTIRGVGFRLSADPHDETP